MTFPIKLSRISVFVLAFLSSEVFQAQHKSEKFWIWERFKINYHFIFIENVPLIYRILAFRLLKTLRKEVSESWRSLTFKSMCSKTVFFYIYLNTISEAPPFSDLSHCLGRYLELAVSTRVGKGGQIVSGTSGGTVRVESFTNCFEMVDSRHHFFCHCRLVGFFFIFSRVFLS